MKILIGVDSYGIYKSSMRLCERLRLPNASYTFAHCVEAVVSLTYARVPGSDADGERMAGLASSAGEIAIERAVLEATGRGLDASKVLLNGSAAESMMEFADENGVDLIAVHSERKGSLGSFFLGSVSRGLAISSRHSLLISKGEVFSEGPINAVFATDHSPYSQLALERFIQMCPTGIKKIHVLTSVHLNDAGPYFSNTNPNLPIEKQLAEDARGKVCDVVEQLTGAGYSTTGHVYNLPVDEAISRGMVNAGANLLILGAQGHGFIHRLALGSTALHQVVVEPYSVLLLRPHTAPLASGVMF